MAKKCVGLPFGAMIALGAILVWAPELFGQMIVTKNKYVISGSVGLAGVTINGFPGQGPILTDQNGAYSAEVEYGWTGTITPIFKGYTFEPRTRTIPKVVAAVSGMDFTASLVTFTISGSVQLPGVKMMGFPGPEEVVSDAQGRYTAEVPMEWSGKVTPVKTAYQFEPPVRPYSNVLRSMPDQNYKASDQMIVISGTAGVPGAVLMGLPGKVVAGPKGAYSAKVKYGESVKVTPTLEGYEFLPPCKEYVALAEDQTAQDYTAKQFVFQISGSAGMAGVTMKGLPGDTVLTDGNGFYTATVPYGWSGMITPDRPGYTFTPRSLPFTKVTASQENRDFSAQAIQYTITGNAGAPGATMSGLPGDPVSDERGQYKATVEYGWVGTVAPSKEGFNFVPPTKDYTNAVTQSQTQDYRAVPIMFKISGTVGQAQVVVKAVPAVPGATSVVSGPTGEYSLDVPYNWKGTITPQKAGLSFDPNARSYDYGVLSAQTNQDFTASKMQCSLVGHIVDENGKDVPDVIVLSEPQAGMTTTDSTGKFELKVDYGWKGKLTFKSEGYILNPTSRTFDTVVQPTTNVAVAAKIRMLTIADKIIAAGNEPVADVIITATPGGAAAKTDLKGTYAVKVPWGWTGELKFEKPGITFEPDTKPFTNVTQDWEGGQPKPAQPLAPTPPAESTSTPPAGPTPNFAPPAGPTPNFAPPAGPTPSPTGPDGETTPAPTPAPSALGQQIQQQLTAANEELEKLTAQINDILQKGGQPTPQMTQQQTDLRARIARLTMQLKQTQSAAASGGLRTLPQGETLPTGPRTPAIGMPTLMNVLAELSKKTGVTIITDATVKSSDTVNLPLSSLAGLPVSEALRLLVNSTPEPYAYRALDESQRAYEVYRPVSNTFAQTRLDEALRTVATTVQFPIVIDPNVIGDVDIMFENKSLEEALQLMLAGKPYVFKRMPNYYLVAGRGLTSPTFPEISQTYRVRLNYTQPYRVKALLSPVFSPYVQAEMPNPRDPNDQGNILLVTAAPGIAERIIEDIKKIDRYKRQVLLDARVVAMDKGNLLNVGVEWGWPTLEAGIFTSSVPDSTTGQAISGWPYGVQLGYGPDRTFTNSLMAALNLLQQNSQADIIAKPQVVSQDGHQAEMRVIQEQWFMMTSTQASGFYAQAQLQKIESGTVLTITPYIGDNNDITLQLAVEVSDSIPKARGSDLPLVTRRMAKNSVTVKDGGTVAVGGLTENRSRTEDKKVPFLGDLPLVGGLFKNKDNDRSSREVAVFVTAHLVPEGTQVTGPAYDSLLSSTAPAAPAVPVGATAPVTPVAPVTPGEQPGDDRYRSELERILAEQNRQ